MWPVGIPQHVIRRGNNRQVQVADTEQAYNRIQGTRNTDYHENLAGLADDVQPFSLQTDQPECAEQVISGLANRSTNLVCSQAKLALRMA